MAHGVERVRPVEGDEPGRAAAIKQDFGSAHAADTSRKMPALPQPRARCAPHGAAPTFDRVPRLLRRRVPIGVALRLLLTGRTTTRVYGQFAKISAAPAASASPASSERHHAEHARNERKRTTASSARAHSSASTAQASACLQRQARRLLGNIDIDGGTGKPCRGHQREQFSRATLISVPQKIAADDVAASSRWCLREFDARADRAAPARSDDRADSRSRREAAGSR